MWVTHPLYANYHCLQCLPNYDLVTHSEKKLSKIRYFILGNLEKSHLRYGNNILNKKKCTPVR